MMVFIAVSLGSTMQAYAADSDFTIEDGVLKKYNGSGGDVVIPNGVTSIGEKAFYNCSSLKSISIPSSVTSIGEGAFDSCSSLTSISIPSSVMSIEGWAFYGCSSLTSISIPSSVTSIGYGAFDGCSSLKNVYYSSDKASWDSISGISAAEIPSTATIHYNHVHTYEITKTTTASTYEKEGTGVYTCTECGATKTDIIPRLSLSRPVISVSNISAGVKLSWAKITGATGYYVYRDGTIVKKLTSGNTITYTDTTAVNGKSYTYTVKAYAGTNKSSLSVGKSIYRVTGTVLTTEVVNGYIKLSWTKNSSATGYKLYKSIDGGEYKFLKNITDSSTLSYKDTAVAAGKKYQYKMVAYITKSDKTYLSAYCGIKTRYYVPTACISGISNQISGIKLTWEKASCDGYVVYRSDDGSEFKAIKTFTSPSTLTYINTTAENGVKYQYKIRAYKTIDGAKRYSAYSSIKTISRVDAVTNAGITATSGKAGIKWTANTKATGYKIYKSTNGSDYTLFKNITSNKTVTFTDTAVKKGDVCKYKIVAYITVSGTDHTSSAVVKTVTIK